MMKRVISLIAVGLFLGCGGGGSDSSFVSGVVSDGYVKGAKVCLDLNKNSVCDDGEPYAYSDDNGKFSIETNLTSFYLVCEGGVNVVTGDKIDKFISFYSKDANITPITTLGVFTDSNMTLAKEKLKRVLGIEDINVFADPQKNLSLLKAAVLINGVSKVLMKNGFSFEDSYKRILNYLENNVSLSDNTEIDFLIEAIMDSVKNLDEDALSLEKDIYEAINGIIDNSSVYIPIGNAFNHKWYKYLRRYPGDNRFLNSKAYILNNDIYLKVYSQNSRSSVFSKDFSFANMIKEDVNVTLSGDAKFSILASTPMDAISSNVLPNLSSNSNLGVYGGVSLYSNSICDFGGVYDGSSIYEKDFVCKDLNTSLKNVQILISSKDEVFSYVVLDENGSSLYSDEINFSKEFNITKSSYLFSYTKSKVQVDSSNEALAVITNFSVSGVEGVEEFLDKLNFTPVSIDTSTFASKKVIIPNQTTIYFTSDGKFYTFDEEGTYTIYKNVLILKGKTTAYIAFSSMDANNVTFSVYYDKNLLSGAGIIASFDENNFYPYPTYVNNLQKVVLGVDDDMITLNDISQVQFNIRDESGNGIECTTNYTSFEDFNNAFSDSVLELNSSDILCGYLKNGNFINASEQKQVIEFINNNDGTYQIYLKSGYFSGDDFNITSIYDSLVLKGE